MPTSKHRKGHKQKSSARTKSMLKRRREAIGLVHQLEEQLQILKDNPITGVDIQPSEMVMLTPSGSLPAHEIKL